MKKQARLIVVLAVIVLVAAGAVVFLQWQREQAEEEAVTKLVQRVETELRKEEPDRGAMQELLREISESPRSGHAALIRAEARLELALGRVQAAWDTIAALSLAPGAEPEELWLSARIKKLMHGQRGDVDDLYQALGFATRAYEATGTVEAAFVAWQCAQRADRKTDMRRFATALRERHRGTAQADLVAAFEDEATTADTLRQLEDRFPLPPPEELDCAIAVALTQGTSPGDIDPDAIEEAIFRLERALSTYPAWVMARGAIALAYHLGGDEKRRDLHLDWLLENAPAGDARREQWQWLRGQPAGGR